MAVTIAAQAQLSRSGLFFDPTKDWTWFQQIKNGATTPGGAFFRLYLAYGDPASIHSYIALRSPAASNNIVLKTFDGSTTSTSTAFTPTASVWAWIGATYVAATHTLTFYANSSTPVGTLSVNLSTFVFIEKTSAIGSTVAGTSFGDYGVNYGRQWQLALTGAGLVLEASSKTPVQSGTLLTDTPIQASIDLTAHNNTVTQWSATGTITTDTSDALISVVAGPPANVSPATATSVTTTNAYFQDVNTTGVATTVWHVCTAPTSVVEMGAMAFGDLVTYKPTIRVYEGLANANANIPMPAISHNVPNAPIQVPVTAGVDYYFQTVRNGAVAASTLQFSVLKALNLIIPAGSFAVNDDAPGLPLVLLDRLTGYPIQFVNPFPAGEGGSVLPSGIVAVTNDDDVGAGNSVTLASGTTITSTVNLAPDSGYQSVSDNQAKTFYAGTPSDSVLGKSKIVAISDAGVLSATSWNLPQSGLYTLGVNSSGTIAYYGTNAGAAQAIHSYDLIGNTALPDLVTGPAGHVTCKDILVMSDGSILVLFNQNAVSLLLNQYTPAGVLVLSTNLGANTSKTIDARLAWALEADHVWVWQKLNAPSGFDIFLRVRISDGAVIETTPNTAEFEGGMNQAAASATPIRFGHSESCPFWIIQGSVGPPTETFPIRRQRRFLLPSSDSNHVMQIPIIELRMRTGIGLKPDAWDSGLNEPLGADPKIMIRLSKDGGKTWGAERVISAGKRGEFWDRVRLLQATGNYRNAVLEVTVDDPVDWQFLAALAPVGIIEGSS